MTTHHTSTGARHDGDEFDCGFCRAGLLEAFRAPAEPVRVPGERCTPGETCSPEIPCTEHFHHPRPHLIVPGDRVRTVDMTQAHHAVGVAVPYGDDRPGGIWRAYCPCGWVKKGAYARNGIGTLVAQRLAETWASRHRDSPLADPEADHAPIVTVTPSGPGSGDGEWMAACDCGWRERGFYGPGLRAPGPVDARTLAQGYADEHRRTGE